LPNGNKTRNYDIFMIVQSKLKSLLVFSFFLILEIAYCFYKLLLYNFL